MVTIEISPTAFAEIEAILKEQMGRVPEQAFIGGLNRWCLDMTNVRLVAPAVQCPDCAAHLQVTGPATLKHLKHVT